MNNYTVITADIIASKNYTDLNNSILNRLQNVNTLLKDQLYIPFTSSRGDEIQCVCKHHNSLPIIIRNLRNECRPFDLRIGIGIGKVDYWGDNSLLSSWDANGEAFHFARLALDTIKNSKEPQTYFITSKAELNLILNTIYSLMDTIMAEWTVAQWDAVHAYERNGTYKLAGEKLQINSGNVYKRCNAAKWKVVKKCEDNIPNIFYNHLDKGAPITTDRVSIPQKG